MELVYGALVLAALYVFFRWVRSPKLEIQPPRIDPEIDIPIRVTITTSSYHEERSGNERDPRDPNLPRYDAWETDILSGLPGSVDVQLDARLSYVDGDGQPSTRKITTRSLTPWNGEFAILAHCHGRSSHRTFLLSRIKEFVDLSTGEVVIDVRKHLMEAYRGTPAGQVAAAFEAHADEVTALLFVGRANGTLSPRERQILLGFVQNECASIDASADIWRKAIPEGSPPVRDFKSALGRVAKYEPERRARLVNAISAMSPKGTNEITKGAAAEALAAIS